MILSRSRFGGFVRLVLALGSLGLAIAPPLCPAQPAAAPTAAAAASDTNSTPAAATNAAPHFWVQGYEVLGNTLLPDATLKAIFDRHTGLNIGFDDISSALKELQLEYHWRGYDTISVTIPQQRITNGIFKIRVFEGRLAEILVKGNRHYSSNNVMRALPGLKTNLILNSKLFQPELDRANANQDRQIFPEIHPGPETNTTSLFLVVKDRLPLHAKIEANNQSSPGTPEMRLNNSAVYNNLWQRDHSLGVQYSFSEEAYKDGNQWALYDRPLVVNYSAFYRMPLAAPESLADTAASHPAKFGYDEATKKFELPAPSGTPELNVFASRSTMDTGVTTTAPKTLDRSVSHSIAQASDHQDVTVSEDIGFRLSKPMPDFYGVRSHAQAGLDYKTYRLSSFTTNDIIVTQNLIDSVTGNPYSIVSTTPQPVPASKKMLYYVPLSLRWDGDRPDEEGSTTFGIGYSADIYFSNGRTNVQSVAGSRRASGYWHIASANLGREQNLGGEWKLALRADGQWASEPLISNEQFGVGGVNGVRGFREGEVFGDTGWRVTSELKTPPHRVGYVGAGTGRPLTIRASAFLDYADTYLLDPNGRPGKTPLCGGGIGGAASLGSKFEGRLFFAWPILNTPTSESGQIRVSFALSAEF